ncbi:MAG: SDR family NAD(P)-dependent oxidoreductase [Gemmatimonadota bacterium]
MTDLTGKVAIVTGAARGQGAAESVALARAGATVIAADILPEPAELPAEAETGPGVIHYRLLDVSRPEQWAELAQWTGERFGRVDGLVNNAGIPMRARLPEITLADWERALSVNLTGALLGIQAVLPLMGRGGSIVNVGSAAALTAHYPVAYTVSKWGLRGLSRVASMELGGRGIRVNSIHPGFIDTPMTASAPPAFRESNLLQIPLGRAGTPGDIAPLVVFLISDESSFISGAEIPIDGGQTAHAGAMQISEAIRASQA